MGMDLNTAFRMFMEPTRMVRGLPFPATLPETHLTREEARQSNPFRKTLRILL